MLLKRLKKELKIIKENNSLNCTAYPINDNSMKWEGYIIGPKDTPYEGGKFYLNIEFSENYPYKPPYIYFITPIYHCNINSQGEICLDILKSEWSPALNIITLLISISSLLSEPNPNDPLVINIAQEYNKNKEKHDKNAKDYTNKYANKNNI
jgi:ubiquitin-conjugating enzyme E2 D/E